MKMSNVTADYPLNSSDDNAIFSVLPLRVCSLTFTFISVALLSYIVVALSFYGYKKKLLIGCRDTKLSSKNRSTAIVNSATLGGGIFVLMYVAIEFPLIAEPVEDFCGVYHRIKIISFACTMLCLYFALWFRVFTIFYRNPVMRRGISKAMQVVTVLPLPLLFIMVGSNLYSFLSAPAYTNFWGGCMPRQEAEKNGLKWTVLVICTTAFQGTLLFSFIYPLYLHRKKMLDRGFDHKAIIPIVKRAAIVAAVCVVSDLANSGFAIAYKGRTVYLNHIVFSCNLIVNLMGTVLSFANWRKKLFIFAEEDDRSTVQVKLTGRRNSSTWSTGQQNLVYTTSDGTEQKCQIDSIA